MDKEGYCIICGKKKYGTEVEEGNVIKIIRWLKKNVTKNEKGNRLVVCSECYPKYTKYRSRFEKRLALYLILGILFLAFGLLLSFKLDTFILGLFVILLMYFFALLNYMPKLKEAKSAEKKV
ncbi:MAG: hypothetical protein ACP5RF_01930 [Candidatus Micrarchaeia archaeon]